MHVIAAKAVAFGEALQPEFKTYAGRWSPMRGRLAATLVDAGWRSSAAGTDSHLMLVDLRPKGVTGKAAEASLERAYMTCNKNGIPFDPEKPMVTSGVRLGRRPGPRAASGQAEFQGGGRLIAEVVDGLSRHRTTTAQRRSEARAKVLDLTGRHPIYAR
jgi:glycine hydroxymethyltransferase